MTQQLGAHSTLVEDLSSVPSISDNIQASVIPAVFLGLLYHFVPV